MRRGWVSFPIVLGLVVAGCGGPDGLQLGWPSPSPPSQAPAGVDVMTLACDSGTGPFPGQAQVTNGASGAVGLSSINPNSSQADVCVAISRAADRAGVRADLDGVTT